MLVISNRPRTSHSSAFEITYSRDYSLNCTPLGPVTITKRVVLRLLDLSPFLSCSSATIAMAFAAFSLCQQGSVKEIK